MCLKMFYIITSRQFVGNDEIEIFKLRIGHQGGLVKFCMVNQQNMLEALSHHHFFYLIFF